VCLPDRYPQSEVDTGSERNTDKSGIECGGPAPHGERRPAKANRPSNPSYDGAVRVDSLEGRIPLRQVGGRLAKNIAQCPYHSSARYVYRQRGSKGKTGGRAHDGPRQESPLG